MIAAKKESSPGPDGIPGSIYRCAGGLGSHFLFNAYKRVLEGGAVSHTLMQAGPSSFPSLPLSTTMVSL